MTEYSDTFLDHYRRPRNLGDLADPDAVSIVHDARCGDLLRLAIRLEVRDRGVDPGNRRIAEARFKAFGCAATIAVASAITELVSGITVDEAAAVAQRDIVEALDGLPPQRLHAAALGRAAIEEVLAHAGLDDPGNKA